MQKHSSFILVHNVIMNFGSSVSIPVNERVAKTPHLLEVLVVDADTCTRVMPARGVVKT